MKAVTLQMNGELSVIKVYHGTNLTSAFDIWKNGIDLNKSLPNLDFGKGFYVTDNKKKAEDRAWKKTADYNRRNKTKDVPCLVVMNIDDSYFKKLNLKVFKEREDDWFKFVVNNRFDLKYLEKNGITNHNKDNRYDIVFGEIADGSVAQIVNDIKDGAYNMDEINYESVLTDDCSFYGNQYSFHTKKSLSCIKNIECVIMRTRLEKRRRR